MEDPEPPYAWWTVVVLGLTACAHVKLSYTVGVEVKQ